MPLWKILQRTVRLVKQYLTTWTSVFPQQIISLNKHTTDTKIFCYSSVYLSKVLGEQIWFLLIVVYAFLLWTLAQISSHLTCKCRCLEHTTVYIQEYKNSEDHRKMPCYSKNKAQDSRILVVQNCSSPRSSCVHKNTHQCQTCKPGAKAAGGEGRGSTRGTATPHGPTWASRNAPHCPMDTNGARPLLACARGHSSLPAVSVLSQDAVRVGMLPFEQSQFRTEMLQRLLSTPLTSQQLTQGLKTESAIHWFALMFL